MEISLVDVLLTVVTFVISTGGYYLVSFLNSKIGNENLKNYYEIAKTVVMSIEQLNPDFSGEDKKNLAISKIKELTNNKLSDQDIEVLLESSVYEVKKLLNSISK